MGICGSKNMSPEDRLAAERSRKIDNENEEDFDKELEKIKLLLLGINHINKHFKDLINPIKFYIFKFVFKIT